MTYALQAAQRIKCKFRSSTLSFLFIIAYVNLFPILFGPENSIVGVIFTIMMSASMVRDLTATPFRHLARQSALLVWMAVAACLVTVLPAPWSLAVNFATLFGILYTFTYEYSSHIYFPYILSYLFLIFISPVGTENLGRRILGMLAGAVSIILYQWFMGRNRAEETAKDELGEMTEDIRALIAGRQNGASACPDMDSMHRKLCRLSRTVYERRKKVLCISDASFSMVAAGRGLEHLLTLVCELPDPLTDKDRAFLSQLDRHLAAFSAYLCRETAEIPEIPADSFCDLECEETARLFCRTLVYIRDRLLHMRDPEKRAHYRKTALSFRVRLMAALDVSPVRAVYALRTALLLSCATLFVQAFSLPHGKWLLFTLASVSLPYADDVPVKMKKRVQATITGGLISVVLYALIPSPAGRTAAMMLSGYLSFYFTDYAETFACSTVGALGGAVFMEMFGFRAVGSVFLIRLGYILAGATLAYAANCLLFPFSRALATRQLWKKYKSITELLTRVCHSEDADPQLYYSLVIQAYLLEEKLTKNAHLEEWAQLPLLLAQCREQVRLAHRDRAERAGAPVFEGGHLR